jgi:hypothetical protein
VYPPIRPLPQPGLKPIVPQTAPKPAITKDPNWYQADTPTTKAWKPKITGNFIIIDKIMIKLIIAFII